MTHTPPRRRGFLRALTWFLSLVMVPVVVLATPNVASAAGAVYGTPAAAQIDWTSSFSGFSQVWETVTLSAYWVVDPTVTTPEPYIKIRGGQISVGEGSRRMGAPDCDTSDCSSITFTFNGDGCSLSGAAPVRDAGFDWTYDQPVMMLGTGTEGCNVSEVCAELHIYRNNFPDSDRARECAPIALGMPPGGVPNDTCQVNGGRVKLHGIGRSFRINTRNEKFYNYGPNLTVEGTSAHLHTLALRGPTSAPEFVNPNEGPSNGGEHYGTGTHPLGKAEWSVLDIIETDPQPWGFMVWVSTPLNDNFDEYDLFKRFPQTVAGGRMGTTVEGNCWWYLGPKIATAPWTPVGGTASVGSDSPYLTDPLTPLPEPPGGSEVEPEPDPVLPVEPPAVDEACSFSITDPTTWLEGGMCAAVGWLHQIWGLLSDLPGAVAGLFRGLLGDLFMPEAGYLDAKVGTTRAALDDTAPAKWVGAFDNLTPGAVQGCEGILIEPPRPDGEGVMFSERLGAACSGGMASAASLFKIAISAALVIGGGLACIRALGSGFGWNPGVGQGGQQA